MIHLVTHLTLLTAPALCTSRAHLLYTTPPPPHLYRPALHTPCARTSFTAARHASLPLSYLAPLAHTAHAHCRISAASAISSAHWRRGAEQAALLSRLSAFFSACCAARPAARDVPPVAGGIGAARIGGKLHARRAARLRAPSYPAHVPSAHAYCLRFVRTAHHTRLRVRLATRYRGALHQRRLALIGALTATGS